MNPFLKFLQSARNLAKNQDLSKEDVLKFAKNEFGDITGLMRAQIDQIFKPGKQAIKKQTDNIVSIKKDDIPKKAEGGIMRANYARGTDLEAGAQPITIEGDVRPNNMMMASESPEEELEMLKVTNSYNICVPDTAMWGAAIETIKKSYSPTLSRATAWITKLRK